MGILDTIIDAHQKESLQDFELDVIISKILNPLKDREKTILSKRYGLEGNGLETLKTVGEEQGLTRERVRQIEKELLKNLKRGVEELEDFIKARDLLVSTISDHGGLMSEKALFNFLGFTEPEDINALKFILKLTIELEEHSADKHIRQSWAKIGFDKKFLHRFVETTKDLLEDHGKPVDADVFLKKIEGSDFFEEHKDRLTPKVLLNYLESIAGVKKNPFGEYGLHHWNEIKPKDVGDKAYLVMKHHGKPEHYSEITNLINKHAIDKRKAYKETVHNKLIKDKRFVLVGRGIYALSEWGYKPGVVSDIIVNIIKESGQPVSRDEIVKQVLERRMVKRNTVLVGLSNKKLFKKAGKNMYDLV